MPLLPSQNALLDYLAIRKGARVMANLKPDEIRVLARQIASELSKQLSDFVTPDIDNECFDCTGDFAKNCGKGGGKFDFTIPKAREEEGSVITVAEEPEPVG